MAIDALQFLSPGAPQPSLWSSIDLEYSVRWLDLDVYREARARRSRDLLEANGGVKTIHLGSRDPGSFPTVAHYWARYSSAAPMTRHESYGPNPFICVSTGSEWRGHEPLRGSSYAGQPRQGPGFRLEALLDPRNLVGAFRFAMIGSAIVATRPTFSVAATRVMEPALRPPPLEPSEDRRRMAGGDVQEATLEIDQTRGVVLRRIEQISGQPVRVMEVEMVTYDSDLPVTLFAPESIGEPLGRSD